MTKTEIREIWIEYAGDTAVDFAAIGGDFPKYVVDNYPEHSVQDVYNFIREELESIYENNGRTK